MPFSEILARTIPAFPIILFALSSAFAQAPRGIPRELARRRAEVISDLRYRVSFVLTPNADEASGEEDVRFKLKSLQPVLLDFRDGRLIGASVNGAAVALKAENGHLELPVNSLRAGRERGSLPLCRSGCAGRKAAHALRRSRRQLPIHLQLICSHGCQHGLPLFRSAGFEGPLYPRNHRP